MNSKRNLWMFSGIVILVAALVSGFVLMQSSAEDILVQTIETAKTITDGHAVVAITVNTLEQDTNGTLEVWAIRGEDGPGAFRVEVLESNDEKAMDAVIVSDGETLWDNSPSENNVLWAPPKKPRPLWKKTSLWLVNSVIFVRVKKVNMRKKATMERVIMMMPIPNTLKAPRKPWPNY